MDPQPSRLNRRAALIASAAASLVAIGRGPSLAAADPAAKPEPRKDSVAPRLPRIIDVHAHPRMPSFVAATRANAPARPPAGAPRREWTPEVGIELMDEHGIEVMMMSNPAGMTRKRGKNAVALCRKVNDDMAAVIAAQPRRYGAFAMLPIDDIDASLKEMAYALDNLRFDGVCLVTNVDGVYPGDKRFAPLFAELNRRKSVAFVHPAQPFYFEQLAEKLPFNVQLMEYMIDSNRAVASMVFSGMRTAYPDFSYIAAHGGGTVPFLVHRFETGRTAAAAYGIPMTEEEIRRGFQSFHYELTATTGAEQIAAILELVDASHLMFGFDTPDRPNNLIDPSRAELSGSRLLRDADLVAIARGNALRLFPQLAKRLKS